MLIVNHAGSCHAHGHHVNHAGSCHHHVSHAGSCHHHVSHAGYSFLLAVFKFYISQGGTVKKKTIFNETVSLIIIYQVNP